MLDTQFFVFDDFDDSLLSGVGRNLIETATQLPTRHRPIIEVWINSRGGYVSVFKSFLDAFHIAQQRGIRVSTVVTGEACSAGSMLAVAGTPGLRFMTKTAHHMLHYGYTASEATTPGEWERTAAQSQEHFKYVVYHYRKYARVPKLEKQLQDDQLFVGLGQAIRWGLVDGEY